ncbi:hypothetical protein FYK35_24865, partial [Enterobacter hormaechei]
SSRRGNKIPFRRRIDSSKPTYRQNRCCKNGSDHRFRFLRRPHLGKNSFHIHCQDRRGKAVYRKKFTRPKLIEFLATCPATTIA